MADQNLNREINLTLNDGVSPTLTEIGQKWQQLTAEIAATDEQVAALDARLAQFRQTANGAFQDTANSNRFATGVAKQIIAEVDQLRQAREQLQAEHLAITGLFNQSVASQGGFEPFTTPQGTRGVNLPLEAEGVDLMRTGLEQIAAAEAKVAEEAALAGKNIELMTARQETAVQNLSRQILVASDNLNKLASKHAELVLDTNVNQVSEQLVRLFDEVQALAGKPYEVEITTSIAQARAEFADAQLQIQQAVGDIAGERHGRGFGESFAHALSVTFFYGAAFQVLSQIQQTLGSAIGGLIAQPAARESAVAVYTRELGSATDAQDRFNAVMDESIKTGIPDEQLIKLDQRLAQIGVTSETAQSRFGRSLEQVRKDLEDLSQVPGVTPTQVEEFFTRSSDGANRLILSLKSAGVATTGELQRLGVVFNQGGTQILSDSNTTTSALLALIEEKFSGLSAAHAQTMEGMQTRTKNTWDRILQVVGQPVFAQAEKGMRGLLDEADKPHTMQGLQNLGVELGKVVELVSYASDTLGKLIALPGMEQSLLFKTLGGTPNANTPDYGSAIDQLYTLSGLQKDTVDSEGELNSAVADFGTTASNAYDMATSAAEQHRVEIQRLTDAISAARETVSAYHIDFQDAEAPLKDALASVRETQTERMASFDAILQPLQAQRTAIQEAASAAAVANQNQIQGIQQQLQGVQDQAALIKQHYQDAIAPLQDQVRELDRAYQIQQEQRRLADESRNIARDQALAVDIYSSEGRAAATRLPGELLQRQDTIAGMQHEAQKNALDDQIRQIQAAQAAAERAVQNTERAYQQRIQALQNAGREEQNNYRQAEVMLDGRIKKIQEARTAEQAYFKGIEDNLQRQITALDTAYARVERGAQAVENAAQRHIKDLSTVQDVIGQTGAGVLTFMDSVMERIVAAARVFNAYQQIPTGNRDYTLPGRAGGGDVDQGFYMVGENGPEVLHAGGRGHIDSLAAAGMRGSELRGQITLVGMDSMNREVFRQMVRVERGYIDQQIALNMKDTRA